MPTSIQNYYELLGVDRSATSKDIQKAMRGLAKKYHGDRNRDPEAERKMKAINEAYAVLRDAEKRSAYDRTIFDNPHSEKKESVIYGGPPTVAQTMLGQTLVSDLEPISHGVKGVDLHVNEEKAKYRMTQKENEENQRNELATMVCPTDIAMINAYLQAGQSKKSKEWTIRVPKAYRNGTGEAQWKIRVKNDQKTGLSPIEIYKNTGHWNGQADEQWTLISASESIPIKNAPKGFISYVNKLRSIADFVKDGSTNSIINALSSETNRHFFRNYFTQQGNKDFYSFSDFPNRFIVEAGKEGITLALQTTNHDELGRLYNEARLWHTVIDLEPVVETRSETGGLARLRDTFIDWKTRLKGGSEGGSGYFG